MLIYIYIWNLVPIKVVYEASGGRQDDMLCHTTSELALKQMGALGWERVEILAQQAT